MALLTRLIESRDAGDTAAVSFEVFMPASPEAAELMRAKLDRFAGLEPLFIDVAGYGSRDTLRDSVKLALHAKKYAGIASCVHVQHGLLSKLEITEFLDYAQACGVRDVFVEHGAIEGRQPAAPRAPCTGSPLEVTAAELAADAATYFESPVALIKFIKERYGGLFAIVVAGYPGETGEAGQSYEAGLRTLADKQAAGAQLVLAQHTYEAGTFLRFCEDAARSGVTVPIIPSIMLLQNAATTVQVNSACGARLPARWSSALSATGEDEQAYKQVGMQLTVELCKDLLSAGVTVLHFITLNLETVSRALLTELGLSGPGAAARRKLPWRPSGDEARAGEDVRPIFWANRPASYVERTSTWSTFPCGRWASRSRGGPGQDGSKTFTDIADHHLVPASAGSAEERRAMWGEAPRAHEDIWSVFAGYVEGRVPRLPWCEVALLPETSVIQTQLATLNREGFLTINSQPQVNAARSDDPTFGWGGPGGYVYQKAYVECFCPPSHVCALMDACASGRRPGITYHAVDVNGRGFTNSKAGAGAAAAASGGVLPEDAPWSSVNAVTWGVFPEKEILQPTVMDPDAFRGAWRAEAFALWTRQWAVVYDDDSDSADLLHSIHDSYWLVNIVDNDFLGGDVFGVFEDALRGLKAQRQGAGLPVVQGPGQGQAQGQGAAGTGSGAASAGTSQDPATTYASLVARGAICSTPPLAGRTGSYTGLSSLGALAASPAARSA